MATWDLLAWHCTPALDGLSSLRSVWLKCGVCLVSSHRFVERPSQHPQNLTLLWTPAGYALSIFIPVSFICILPYEILRWVLVAVATFTSGLFLLTNFKAPIYDTAGAK